MLIADNETNFVRRFFGNQIGHWHGALAVVVVVVVVVVVTVVVVTGGGGWCGVSCAARTEPQ